MPPADQRLTLWDEAGNEITSIEQEDGAPALVDVHGDDAGQVTTLASDGNITVWHPGEDNGFLKVAEG